MKFFIPYTEDEEEAAIVFSGITRLAEEVVGNSAVVAKIAKLNYSFNGTHFEAEVGQKEEISGEPVIAILKVPNAFLVYTPSRGVAEGTPIYVEGDEVIAFTRFEEES